MNMLKTQIGQGTNESVVNLREELRTLSGLYRNSALALALVWGRPMGIPLIGDQANARVWVDKHQLDAVAQLRILAKRTPVSVVQVEYLAKGIWGRRATTSVWCVGAIIGRQMAAELVDSNGPHSEKVTEQIQSAIFSMISQIADLIKLGSKPSELTPRQLDQLRKTSFETSEYYESVSQEWLMGILPRIDAALDWVYHGGGNVADSNKGLLLAEILEDVLMPSVLSDDTLVKFTGAVKW